MTTVGKTLLYVGLLGLVALLAGKAGGENPPYTFIQVAGVLLMLPFLVWGGWSVLLYVLRSITKTVSSAWHQGKGD